MEVGAGEWVVAGWEGSLSQRAAVVRSRAGDHYAVIWIRRGN
jgi:hypothetical protein